LPSTGRLCKKLPKATSTPRFVGWIDKGRLWPVLHRNKPSLLPSTTWSLVEQHQSVVVVSQTWSEIHRVNEQVRAALKSHGLLGTQDRAVTALETVDLTEAQKRDRRFYQEDTVLVLNRNAGGLQKGQTCRLVAITDRGLVLESADKVRTVPFRFADRLTVCQPKPSCWRPVTACN
jgi:hypothetical protein